MLPPVTASGKISGLAAGESPPFEASL